MASRRSFMAGMLAACAAPAVVKAGSLMKIVAPSIILPDNMVLNIGRGMTGPIWVMDESPMQEHLQDPELALKNIRTRAINEVRFMADQLYWGSRMPLAPEQASHFTKGQLIYANNDFLKRIGRR